MLFVPPVDAAVQGCEEFVGNECVDLKWERIEVRSGDIAEIAISSSDPKIMYAGIEVNALAFYKSVDGGKNWKRIIGPGDHAKDVAISPINSGKAYVALSESIHTTDLTVNPTSRSMFQNPTIQSETKDILSSGLPPGPSERSFSTIEIFENDDKVIYAAVKGGSSNPFASGTNPIIFKTTNGGNTWTRIEPDLRQVSVIEIHPQDHNKIFIGSNDGVYTSNDSGNTVEKLKLFPDSVISIEVQGDNPNVVYAASSSKVLSSDDDGKTWQDITGQLSKIHRVRVSSSNSNVLYAATYDGIFKSEDFGNTWIDKTNNLKSKNIQIVTIHPENANIAFVGHSSLWSSVRSEDKFRSGLLAHQGIFKTVDGGDSWFRSDDGILEYDIEEIATNPTKENEAWISAKASRGGYKTEDAGHNWSTTQIHTLHYPMKIKFSCQNPNMVYVTSWHPNGPFAKSDDGGITWSMTPENSFFSGLNSGQNLFKASSQGGSAIHLHGLAIDPNNHSLIYVGSVQDALQPGNFLLDGSHIFKSVDSGKTWVESDEGFPHESYTSVHEIVIDPNDTSVIYAGTTEYESFTGIGVFKSTDSGKTWSDINDGLGNLNVRAIIINPEDSSTLLSGTKGGIYKSSNGGESWSKVASTTTTDIEYVLTSPNVVYASTNDGVLKSNDFGDNWYNVNYGLPKGQGQGIGVDLTGNVIYTSIQNKGAYVARLVDIESIDPVTQFGGYGYLNYSFGATSERSDSSCLSVTSKKQADLKIPDWIKNNAKWWASDQIPDSAFLQGIQFLIKEGIMVIPPTVASESSGSQEVPGWIKNNASWWAEGQIDDNTFVSGIQHLVKIGIIKVS